LAVFSPLRQLRTAAPCRSERRLPGRLAPRDDRPPRAMRKPAWVTGCHVRGGSLSQFGGTATRSLYGTNVAQHPCRRRTPLCGHRTSATRHRRDLHGSHRASAAPSPSGNLIRLREQKLLRQVFERLQDRLLCTFLKVDWLEADERRVVGDQAVDASLNLFHLKGLLERLAQHP